VQPRDERLWARVDRTLFVRNAPKVLISGILATVAAPVFAFLDHNYAPAIACGVVGPFFTFYWFLRLRPRWKQLGKNRRRQ
jgi:hypothetical protein